jgi:hypothetical protein
LFITISAIATPGSANADWPNVTAASSISSFFFVGDFGTVGEEDLDDFDLADFDLADLAEATVPESSIVFLDLDVEPTDLAPLISS